MVKKYLKRNVPLSCYTTYNIGGIADFFVEVSSVKKMKEVLQYARDSGIPYFVLGGGSNILIHDNGIRGLVIKNSSKVCSFDEYFVTAESGISLDKLIRESAKRGLGGISFLAGIPGSLGGAIYGNAGAYGKSISDVLIGGTIITREGEEKEVDCGYFQFKYRYSRIKETKDVILSAKLKLIPMDKKIINEEIENIITEREKKHPQCVGTCGCYFKNVDTPGAPRISAGKLLEEVGAKEMSFGRAQVSREHANFIINLGGATAMDVRELGELLKNKVYERFRILLEEEVQIIEERI